MLLSMTGYGRNVVTYKEKSIVVELKSLNGKYLDLKIKMPQQYKQKEMAIRQLIAKKVIRGKVDVTIDVKNASDAGFSLNKSLFTNYYKQLSSLASDLEINQGDMLQSIIRLPNVVEEFNEELEAKEWEVLQEAVLKAVENLTEFRRTEGAAMETDLDLRINNIIQKIEDIKVHEADRKVKFRAKILKNLEENIPKDAVDQNRFEQELLYYLEKIDINEEKVRLSQHCKFFLEELALEKSSKGKKLNFICQEIGREVNTIGSKANHSDIQHIVVQMKDDLEKTKEQVANIL